MTIEIYTKKCFVILRNASLGIINEPGNIGAVYLPPRVPSISLMVLYGVSMDNDYVICRKFYWICFTTNGEISPNQLSCGCNLSDALSKMEGR